MNYVTTQNKTPSTGAAPELLNRLFHQAGVTINGQQPWDIQIIHSKAYRDILMKWSLGLGESYMNHDWECRSIDNLICKLLDANLDEQVKGFARIPIAWHTIKSRLVNLQSIGRAFQVAEQHYDIGNDLFERMLDPLMMYSCGYWQYATTLEQAQRDKLEMICQKLELKPHDTLLEVGCGWGGLAYYAAKHYGVKVLGITVSKEQKKIAEERCQGLPVTIELMDYRELNGQFDKIVSVGMFEHVGLKNYQDFFTIIKRSLKDSGLFLLHTIGNADSSRGTDPWINRYIFPNGKIPSALDIVKNIEGKFLVEDWHNFGHDYDRTLMAWHQQFNDHWPEIKSRYDDRFYRMWNYYLLSCAGYFRSRYGQLWQIILTTRHRRQDYRSVRLQHQ
ncbi:cyclopropane-fatty-acyl-phospholipid synthase [Ferrovum sp. JA12]|uniref:cyclopropane fatty acyl phospholipid synthase n=1 Tax=Ferrovum sp. JA12 TaxID=1356299 RepID=UPI000703116E|nr:cyclopropane fatty acyl phospholipid synthase [Ferrovum sp. JA12]KRH79096.1 cyclopropane-fatty-acyl-phospholipid synthase [Ferrovum sp. JA12]